MKSLSATAPMAHSSPSFPADSGGMENSTASETELYLRHATEMHRRIRGAHLDGQKVGVGGVRDVARERHVRRPGVVLHRPEVQLRWRTRGQIASF